MAIDLIVNPRARLYQRDPSLLERVSAAARGSAELHVTESLAELEQTARRIAERGSDLILISGGDGTLMATVSALHAAYGARPLPPLTPIPGGTAGTVARNWKLYGDPERCVRRMLLGPTRVATRPSLALRIHDAGSAPLERVGFIFGTGLVAKFFQLYYERGAPGYAGSALLVSQIFAESFVGGPMARRVLEPLPCRLEVDGWCAEPAAWSLICSAVVRNLGIHMLVTHRGGEDVTRPHLVATPMSPRQLGPRAFHVLRGKPLGGPHHVDRLARSFTVRFDDSGPFVLDGELMQASAIEVRAGPRLRVMEPCR